MSGSAKATPLLQKIGFVGSGKMAMALAKGFMAEGLITPAQVFASDISDASLAPWKKLGAKTTNNNTQVLKSSDIVFIAVKPHIFPSVIQDFRNEAKGVTDSKLYVSILTGVKTQTLYDGLSSVVPNPRVIRVAPNTPALVGSGSSAYSLGPGALKEDGEIVNKLLTSVGICEEAPERLLDAVGALSASGPAYIYTVIEGLADGGVVQGLPRAMAIKFAAQTVMGAAKMVLETGTHTGQLKDEVTSPGGTTIRGIQVIDRAGVRGTMMDAIQAAANRAIELGKQA